MAYDVGRATTVSDVLARFRSPGVCFLFVSVMGLGCSQTQLPPDLVALGSVTFNGKPLPLGELRMVPDDKGGNPVTTMIQSDGRYRATGLRPGRYRVSVQTSGFMLPEFVSREPEKGEKGGEDSSKAGLVPIPDKYEKVETSGLAVEIKEKTNEHNIELK
jgi:hypothetical protein